jgi:hypothetical protein
MSGLFDDFKTPGQAGFFAAAFLALIAIFFRLR